MHSVRISCNGKLPNVFQVQNLADYLNILMLILISVLLKTHRKYHSLKTLQYPFKTCKFTRQLHKKWQILK